MPKREVEFCRRQAERMHALAQQRTDLNISDQVEAISWEWAKKAAVAQVRANWRALRGFILR